MIKIQDFINNRNKYKVDKTYQRPADAWSNEDNQCLIDTILRGEPIPLFFMNYITKKDIYFIVDGQQRLNAIEKFYDNKLKLNKKFSGKKLHGKTFNGSDALDNSDKEKFLNYKISFFILEDYDDERIRLIFSRLQRGKPLQLGERLNACPGEIVDCMRDLASNKFLSKSIGVPKNRYGIYPDAARMLFYEKYGAKVCGTNEIFKFFDEFMDLTKKSKEYKNCQNILNYLEKCFPSNPGNYQYLSKHAWVFALYTMVRDLKLIYSMQNKEKLIKKFIETFHGKVISETFRNSNQTYQKFYDNIRGGWSEKIVILRRDILITEFLKTNKLEELDCKRQISEKEKIEAHTLHPLCERCSSKFKDYKEPHYHHIKRFTDAGKSEIQNIMVLCKNCHEILHGKLGKSINQKTNEEEDFDEED